MPVVLAARPHQHRRTLRDRRMGRPWPMRLDRSSLLVQMSAAETTEMEVPMTRLESAALADLICAELDPLMTANGFLRGQSGIGTDVGIVYCTPHREFRRRFPHLAPTIQYGDEGACTDLNIYASVGGRSRLHDIRLDGVSLQEILADEGAGFADEAEAVSELPAAAGAARLRVTLDKLFRRHAII